MKYSGFITAVITKSLSFKPYFVALNAIPFQCMNSAFCFGGWTWAKPELVLALSHVIGYKILAIPCQRWHGFSLQNTQTQYMKMRSNSLVCLKNMNQSCCSNYQDVGWKNKLPGVPAESRTDQQEPKLTQTILFNLKCCQTDQQKNLLRSKK